MDLLLYGAPLSPFVRKVEVVLREKALDFEMENISMPFPDWYTEISPARRMPALRDRDISAEGPNGVIPDSSAILVYLERNREQYRCALIPNGTDVPRFRKPQPRPPGPDRRPDARAGEPDQS